MLSPPDVGALASLACILEASAPKPGNVSPAHSFRDMTFADLAVSAIAIGPALSSAGTEPLGTTISQALEDTRRWVRTNTNLGMVLLLAPLARAALLGGITRQRVREVLDASTVSDAARREPPFP